MINPAQLLSRLYRVAMNWDGQAPVLEDAAATAFGPGQASDADVPAGDAARDPAQQGSRRERPMALPQTVLLDALSQKILLAWLQNRYQTLYPLTLNLGGLEPEKVGLVVQAMAAAILADGVIEEQEREQAASSLKSIGGGEAEQQALLVALDAPQPFAELLRAIQDAGLGTYAYAASLIALNQRSITNQLYLDFLGARLAIPSDVIASLNRRYRR